VPILVFTAGAAQDERRRGREAGASDFVLKPIRRDILWNKLQAHLESTTTSAPVQAAAGGAAQAASSGINPKLARVFLGEADDHLAQIDAALATPIDREAIQRRAHALKSASQHFPANDVTDTARQLERVADSADEATIAGHVESVRLAWRHLRGVLSEAVDDDAKG
jgi:DNA-binding response OmpR family regulator